MFGSIISGGIILDAYGIALDKDNNIYIANGSAHNVAKYNIQGEKIATIGRSGDGDGQFKYFDSPRDMAVTPQGTIYAIDSNRVEKFDRNGHFLSLWNLPNDSTGRKADARKIAVDSKEQIYLAMDYNGIWKYDSSGNFLGTIGADLHEKDKLDNVWDLTLDANDNLYVAQPLSVYKFDFTGKFITNWEIKTFDFQDNTNLVQNIEADHLGNIYINNNNVVEKFDANGKFLLSWTINIDPKYIYDIDGIAVDSQNRVYVLNRLDQKVEIFNGQGQPLNQWSISWPRWLQAGQPFFTICLYTFAIGNLILSFAAMFLRKRYKFTDPPMSFKTIKGYLIAGTSRGRISQLVTIGGSVMGVILGWLSFIVLDSSGGSLRLPNLFSIAGLQVGQTNLVVLGIFLNSILAYTALLVAKKPFLAGILLIAGAMLLLILSPIDPYKLVLNVIPILLGAVLALQTSTGFNLRFRPGSPG